jgi:iron complex outermembrane receptor protein
MKPLYLDKVRSLIFIVPILIFSNFAIAQSLIKGVITGSDGTPLPGATASIKDTGTFAVADVNGQFSIAAPATFPFTLRINSVGYKVQEIQVYEITDEPFEITLIDDSLLDEIVVTSRRRSETPQEIPIPISVVGGSIIEESGAFNVNRVKELVPSVQLYSSNPRNTTLNIRGLGSTFGLTNDGIDPGVGFYVDGVYYARPAATTLDFVDVEQIEVLRGPQGTLFGKNTTAGAFNIKTRPASFTPGAVFELSYGNYGYIQAKSSVTGPLVKDKLAARVSFSGTQRDGTIYNVRTDKYLNDLNNLGIRGQILFTPTDDIEITLIGDATRQRPAEGYTQVIAGVVETRRPAYRQFRNIIADLGWQLPSENPFDRLVDQDGTWRAGNDHGGVSLNVDAKLGPGKLTSTTAWRYWNWDPLNDRDFTGLNSTAKSQATSKFQNWSQEVRYAGDFAKNFSGVVGVFLIGQDLKTDPAHIEEAGPDQWRFQQNTTNTELWQTPGLFDGHGSSTVFTLETFGAAAFANIDWAITPSLHVLPGIRYNYDKKKVDYNRSAYGLYETEDPALIAIRTIYSNQQFQFTTSESNVTGQITLSFKPAQRISTFATYSTSYKPVGVNVGGLPTVGDQPDLSLAQVKPEYTKHFEFGVKTSPSKSAILNIVGYYTDVDDYQTLVQDPSPALLRGYLANAERIRVTGFEIDGNVKIGKSFSLYGSVAYTEGKYVSFKNAPLPLEEVGSRNEDGSSVPFKDISGQRLPGISKWAGNIGGEYSIPVEFFKQNSKFFIALDGYYRSEFSSSATPSLFLNVDEYALVNGRLGLRATEGLSLSVWARNLLNKDYFEQLLAAGGNAGHYAGVLGDPRTFGATIRYSF